MYNYMLCCKKPVHAYVYCEQCVFEVSEERGLLLVEVGEGVSVEDVRAVTGASFQVSTHTHTHTHTHTLFSILFCTRYLLT